MATLASLLSALASGEAVAAARRARTAAIVYALAALAAFCGIGFLIGAGYIWASIRYGSLTAALGFGVGFLVLAGLLVLIHQLSAKARARRRAARRNADLKALGLTAALAVLPSLLKSKAGMGALLGPAAALVAYAIYRENTKPGPDGRDPGAEG